MPTHLRTLGTRTTPQPAIQPFLFGNIPASPELRTTGTPPNVTNSTSIFGLEPFVNGTVVPLPRPGNMLILGSHRNPVPGVFSNATPHMEVRNYPGLDLTCELCTSTYDRHELVCRLVCGHLFHDECWRDHVATENASCCYNCQGSPEVTNIFTHLGPNTPDAAARSLRRMDRRAARIAAAAQQATPVEVETVEVTTTFMVQTADEINDWLQEWPSQPLEEYLETKERTTTQDEVLYLRGEWQQVFLGKTTIPGKNTILVDLGSRVNVVGENTEKRLSATATANGHKTVYTKKNNALLIGGVGDGNARCDYEASIPIAVTFDGRPATKEVYQTNIATGCGADLPAILGADSMQKKDGVLILREGKECLAIPGPGGYSIQWSPGTRILPMRPAPSGHLVVEADNFDMLTDTTSSNSFWMDHRNPQEGEKLPSLM